MLGKVSPVVWLALVYSAGYHLAGALGSVESCGAVTAPAVLIAAAGALGLAYLVLRLSSGLRLRPVWISLTLCCFTLCGLARGIHSRAVMARKVAALEGLCAPAAAAAAEPGASREISAVGVVVGFPRGLRDGTRFVIELLEARADAREVKWSRERPRLSVTVRPAAEVRCGDLLRIDGRCAIPTKPRNPGGFDYAGYLSARNIQGTVKARPCRVCLLDEGLGPPAFARALGPFRRWVRGTIDLALDGEAQGLLYGLLLGDRSRIEPEMRESMAKAGVIHILAVSGLHVGLVALIVVWGARVAGFSGPASERISVLGACLYCALTGFPASACRASVMLAAYVACRCVQRAGGAFQSLAVAAFALALLKPVWVSTAGFQLSFAAAGGVLAFKDCLAGLSERTGLRNVPWLRGLPTLLAASLGASIATWPLLAFHFGRVPLLFLLGNAVAVPLVGLVLAWGICGVLFGVVSSFLSRCMFASCWAASGLLLRCSRLVASVPRASLEVGPFSPALILLYYGALVAAVWGRGWRRAVATAGVCAVAVLTYLNPLRGAGEALLEVTFLDVGHGDACVMLAPTGECVLVGAGGASESRDAGRDVIVPFLRTRRVRCIDRVVISHGDADHWGGLPEISSRVRIGEVVLPRSVPLGDLGDAVSKLAKRGVRVRWVAAGDTLEPLGGLECTVLHPSSEFEEKCGAEVGESRNNRSLVLRVTYGAAAFLFPGDIERVAENWLVQRDAPLSCTVLKVPHHGSDTSSGAEFIRRASPRVAVISCGPRELFNLPKPAVIARYAAAGAARMLTARDGAVTLRTDGTLLWGTSQLNPGRAFRLELHDRHARGGPASPDRLAPQRGRPAAGRVGRRAHRGPAFPPPAPDRRGDNMLSRSRSPRALCACGAACHRISCCMQFPHRPVVSPAVQQSALEGWDPWAIQGRNLLPRFSLECLLRAEEQTSRP